MLFFSTNLHSQFLRFPSLSHLTSLVIIFPKYSNLAFAQLYSTLYISYLIYFVSSMSKYALHVGKFTIFPNTISFVFFLLISNPLTWTSFFNLANISWKFYWPSDIKTISSAYRLLEIECLFTSKFPSINFFIINSLYGKTYPCRAQRLAFGHSLNW